MIYVIIVFCILLNAGATLNLFRLAGKNRNLKYKLAFCERQAKINDEYYSGQIESQKEALAVIHDIRKHIKIMEGLKQADVSSLELKRYADSFENLITPLLDRQYCNNAVLNIILNDKVEYCKKNGIQFDIEICQIAALQMI